MAYDYLSDGGPEDEDYHNNYFLFDESDSHSVDLIEKMLKSNADRNSEFRDHILNICRYSLKHRAKTVGVTNWLGHFIVMIRNFCMHPL